MHPIKAAVLGAAATALSTLALLGTAYARAAEPVPQAFDIGPQSLAAALNEFARQSHAQLLFAPAVVAQKGTHGVHGTMEPVTALRILLKDSGLSYSTTPAGALLIGASGGSALFDSKSTSALAAAQDPPASSRSSLSPASSGGPSAAPPLNGSTPTQSSGPALEEVVVTAQKREERLQDVPVPVTAINAQALVNTNQLRLQDYYTSVPGLGLVSTGAGDTMLSIRGVTTGGGLTPLQAANPTVGVTVDDVPFGASTALAGGTFVPDIDPSDLQRIEVLRGPQGTLYGASSIGGLLKFVTIDPSTQELSGHFQGDVLGVQNGADAGYGIQGALNVPLGDNFGIRASGFARRDPGYVDDPGQNVDGVNRTDVRGGRLSAAWHPSETVSIKLGAYVQGTTADGSPIVNTNILLQPTIGDLKQSLIPGAGKYTQNAQNYSAVVNAKLGSTDLTVVSGYGIYKYSDAIDYSAFYGGFVQPFYQVSSAMVDSLYDTRKFSQEVRLSATARNLDWLVGAFYTTENSSQVNVSNAIDPTNGAVAGLFYTDPIPLSYSEYAAFGDLTWHFTDKFDVQMGGRESQNRQSYQETITGVVNEVFFNQTTPAPYVNPPVHTKDDAFTFLLAPRLKLSQDLMVYARIASGYRPGGPNPTSTLFHLPDHFDPDKTVNYELGLKADTLEGRLSLDASLYYIDWKDIQLQVLDATTGAVYYTNGSRAKSEGVELSVKSSPVTGLTISGWVAATDAELTVDLPANSAAVGSSGDRLPYSSRFSGDLTLDDEFPITSGMRGFVGGSADYIGDRAGVFSPTPQQQRLSFPGYAKFDARAGVRWSSWNATLFLNNASNKRGVIGVNQLGPLFFTNFIQPRTFGLSVADSF